jgi:hypothetical protein
VLALVLDGGLLRDNRRQVQTAADMAALAAATDLFTHYNSAQGLDPNGTAKQSALNNAAANGFNNDGVTNTVTVNLNPAVYQGGEQQGQTIPPGYAEVIVTYQQPSYFSSIWGTQSTQVKARAAARGTWTAARSTVQTLGSSGTTLSIQGGATFTTTGRIHSNSRASNARNTSGGGKILAKEFDFSDDGPYDSTYRKLSTGMYDSSVINPGVPATPDPLGALPAPAQPLTAFTPDGSQAVNIQWIGDNRYGAVNGTLTLSPGTYQGGISASGGSLVLQPGIYYMTGGGLSLSGNASISVSGPASPDTGTGIILYHTPGTGGWSTSAGAGLVTSTTTGSVALTSPTQGIYQGVVGFQDRNSNAPNTVNGNGNVNINGTIYTPSAPLSITANSNATRSDGSPEDNVGSQIISNSLSVSGTGTVSVNSSSAAPVRQIQFIQ